MTDYYVDYANGNDSNNGTSLSTPLKTLMPFDEAGTITLQGGDNVYLRDTATIQMTDKVVFLTLNATSSSRITIQGYQDEKPTIDWSGAPADGRRGMHFYNCDGYITLEQFIVQEIPGNAIHFDALNGNITNNIIVRDVEMYDYGKSSDFNGNGLIFFGRVYDCLVEDTIGMYGHDGGPTTADRSQGDSDTFYVGGNGTHGYSGGHTFRRCIAAHNADDGFDFFDNDPTRPSYMYDCIAYGNGQDHPTSPTAYGDGNGFKVGGGFGTGSQYCIRCVSYDNYADGFDTNGASEQCFFYNCTSYNNGSFGFQFTGSTEPDHVATNNIAYSNSNGATDALYNATSTTNTWDLGITNPQFASTIPGNANFLRLDAGSPCIDVGTNIGYTYTGSAPDLGAYEYDAAGTPTYNGTKAASTALMKEPLSVSENSGFFTVRSGTLDVTAKVNPIGTHASSKAVVDHLVQTTYYIDPVNGDDTNSGVSINDALQSFDPFTNVEKTLNAGDTIQVRGNGTINITEPIVIQNQVGIQGSPIVIEAYEEENPVIDAYQMTSGSAFVLTNVEYLELNDIKIRRAAENAVLVNGASSNITINNVHVEIFGIHGAGSGIVMDGSDCVNNLIRSSIADHGSWQGTSDGFSVINGSGGHTFENCKAYYNCDDGFGLFDATPCTLVRCDSFVSGTNGASATGDGNGFKAGGAVNSGGHTFTKCRAWDNISRGFELSDCSVGNTVRNCTSFDNNVGFRSNTGLDTFQNNLAWMDTTTTSFSVAPAVETTNSWNLGTGDPLFVSTELVYGYGNDTYGSEGYGGSFNDVTGYGELGYGEGGYGGVAQETFLHLQDTSPAIDVGTDIGLPFSGTSPDLGAVEYVESGPPTKTYYVDPVAGSDANNGLTVGAAFKTLEPFDANSGSVSLAGGDTVEIRSGTISMSKNLQITALGDTDEKVLFTNYAGESPVVDFSSISASRAINIFGGLHITIENIEFINSVQNAIVVDGSTSITLDNIAIKNSNNDAIRAINGSVLTITNSTIDNTGRYAVLVDTNSVLTTNVLDITSVGNIAVNVTSDAGSSTLDNIRVIGAHGDAFNITAAHTIQRCLATQCAGDGFNVSSTSASTLYNNTAYANSGYGFNTSVSAHTLKNNLAYLNTLGAFNGAGTETETTNSWNLANPDPRFISVSFDQSGYLTPYGFSDVIDAGTNVGLAYNNVAPDLGSEEGTLLTLPSGTTENGYNLSPTAGSRELEDFETFTIGTDLDGDTANLEYETNPARVHDGVQGIETNIAGEHIAWFSDSYTGEKETYADTTYSSWHWAWNGVTMGAVYMAQTSSTGSADFSGYAVTSLSRSAGNTDELKLLRFDNGTPTTLDSWTGVDLFNNQDAPGKIEFTIDTNGNITVDFYPNNAGTSIQTLTATDTTYKTGRLGFYGNNANSVMDDMSANSTTVASAVYEGNTAIALSDGVTPNSISVVNASRSPASSDYVSPTPTVIPIGTKSSATADILSGTPNVRPVANMVEAITLTTTLDYQPIYIANKAEALSEMVGNVEANVTAVNSLIEALASDAVGTASILANAEKAGALSVLSSPVAKILANAEIVISNAETISSDSPLVLAIGNKADAEMLSNAVQADVSVFVDSVESLASLLAGTAHVDAQGATLAIVSEVVPAIPNVLAIGNTADAQSLMKNVDVNVIALSQKATATGRHITAIDDIIHVYAHRPKIRGFAITADTKNVTVTGEKAKSNAGTFVNESNLQQFNTIWTNGSVKRSIATKGSKEYENQ